jgi:hypothetical protein
VPLPSWQKGVVAIVKLVLPPSQWHRQYSQFAGVFAVVTMVLLPSCTGAIANIAWALWRCRPYCTDLFAPTLNGHHHSCCTGVVAPVKLVCLRRCAGVIALVMLALFFLVSWL